MRIAPFLLASCAVLAACQGAGAATLRPFVQIDGAVVRLGDLFDDLGATPDRALGRGPLPGARIVLRAPQLAAIARDFAVAWRPATGGEQAVVERRADILPPALITDAVRAALRGAGAPEDFEIVAPEIQPVLIPSGSHAAPSISQLAYDPQTSHFTALVSVDVPQMRSVSMRVSGDVIAMVPAAVTAQHLTAGVTLSANDIRTQRVRASLLRNAAPIPRDSAIGMVLKHDIAAGVALTAADLGRTLLVARGSLVRMSLTADGIALSAQGRALDSGAMGEHIRVENPLSHLIVDADVTAPGQVRVIPRPATITLVAAQ
jgi:flagella basal body P-ring formation protein FlgA